MKIKEMIEEMRNEIEEFVYDLEVYGKNYLVSTDITFMDHDDMLRMNKTMKKYGFILETLEVSDDGLQFEFVESD